MSKDTPRPQRTAKERGRGARTGNDPTLASYLSSLLLLFSVPLAILAAYGGYWMDLYAYRYVVPAFGGLIVGVVALAFVVMHVTSGR